MAKSEHKKGKWCDDPHHHLHEGKYADYDTTFALHGVCRDPNTPIKIVKDTYYAYPQAAFTTDDNQHTPIYIAVDSGFEDAVNFLVSVCPDACTICNSVGDTPIQSAIYGTKPSSMINYFIASCPRTAFIPDDCGDSAFDNYFKNWNVFTRIAVNNDIINDDVLDNYTGIGDWKYRDIYEKSSLFLRAATSCKNKRVDGDLLLHCALREESCHWAFCKLLMKLHPNQVLERDADGNLPIHVITASKEVSDEETFLCMDCYTTKSVLVYMELSSDEMKYCCENCFEFESAQSIVTSYRIRPVKKVNEAIKDLIALSPQMTFIPDINGNYPLHIAINNQQSCGVIHEIFKSFPPVGTILDVETRLLPFMLAGVCKWENEQDQINTIYQLLQEDPHSVLGA